MRFDNHDPLRDTLASAQTNAMDLTIDTLLYSIYSTILNPLLCVILTLTLAARSPHWNTTSLQVAVSYSTAVISLRLLLALDARGYFLSGRSQYVPRKLDWSREVVLITGGAGGLGGLIAEIYAIRGVSVAVVDILDETSERVDEWEAKGGAYYCCDVGDAVAVQALKDRVDADVRNVSSSPFIFINSSWPISITMLMAPDNSTARSSDCSHQRSCCRRAVANLKLERSNHCTHLCHEPARPSVYHLHFSPWNARVADPRRHYCHHLVRAGPARVCRPVALHVLQGGNDGAAPLIHCRVAICRKVDRPRHEPDSDRARRAGPAQHAFVRRRDAAEHVLRPRCFGAGSGAYGSGQGRCRYRWRDQCTALCTLDWLVQRVTRGPARIGQRLGGAGSWILEWLYHRQRDKKRMSSSAGCCDGSKWISKNNANNASICLNAE